MDSKNVGRNALSEIVENKNFAIRSFFISARSGTV